MSTAIRRLDVLVCIRKETCDNEVAEKLVACDLKVPTRIRCQIMTD